MTEEYFVPICPKCGSKDVTEQIQGDSDQPNYSHLHELEAQGHKFNFLGCIVEEDLDFDTQQIDDGLEDDDENDNRSYECNACDSKYSWRDWRAKLASKKLSV